MTKNEKLVDAVRTMGQLLLTNGASRDGAFDRDGNCVSPKSKYAHRFSYFAALDVVASKFRSGMKLREFWIYVDEACDNALGKNMFCDIWDNASPKQRKAWAPKLANYTGE